MKRDGVFILFILSISIFLVLADHESLTGHQVWEVASSSPLHREIFNSLHHDGLVDIMGERESFTVLHLIPEHVDSVKRKLNEKNIAFNVIHEDISEHLRAIDQKSRMTKTLMEECTETHCPNPFKSNYMNFEQIGWYLKSLIAEHGADVNLEILGKSHENRDIMMIHIKCQQNCDQNLKKVWIEAGIHAREWISPATILNFLPKLASNSKMRTNIEYYIVPVTNPDGYAHTHSKIGDRLWRKNRRQPSKRDECAGVDLNRNWDHNWGFENGSSGISCSETYRGSKAFSEPETTALKNKMLSIHKEQGGLSLALSLHSYGQLFLYPSVDNKRLKATSNIAAMGKTFADAAKKIHGREFTIGEPANILYPVSGNSDDWAKNSLGAKYASTIELRDEGFFGFLLPADQIVSVVEETWAGFNAMVEKYIA